MDVSFISSVAIITTDPAESGKLYLDALGLPLTAMEGDDYVHGEDLEGAKHFGVWPLSQAAQVCFGAPEWPSDRPVPQVCVEFDMPTVEAVQPAVDELRAQGFDVLHDADRMPWGQTVAHLQSSEGALIGVGFTPPMH